MTTPTTERPALIIYRDTLGALTETFIPAQVEAMQEFRGFYTGTLIRPNVPLDRRYVILPSSSGELPALQRTLFRATGHVPAHWLQGMRLAAPRLVHAHFGPDAAWAIPIARRLRLPLVATFWGHDITVSASASLGYRAYRSMLLPRIFRHADLIIAVSEWIRKLLLDAGAPPSRVQVHYVGTDTQRFRPSAGVERERFVLFVGRLVEKKGVEYLLKAMAVVQKQQPSLDLVIAGDGPLREGLEKLANELNVRCRFEGARTHEQVFELMKRALFLAVPSVTAASGDAEGLPLTLLEGQSMGLPVVATRHSGIPEAVEDGGSGFLVDERDHQALAEAILLLAQDSERRAQMGTAARALMVRKFDLKTQSRELEGLYRRLLDARAGASDHP